MIDAMRKRAPNIRRIIGRAGGTKKPRLDADRQRHCQYRMDILEQESSASYGDA
jgi:hypothetical protein